jgi:RND family efflux transporter MFP subunit
MKRRVLSTLTLLPLALAGCGRHEEPKAVKAITGPTRDVVTATVVRTGGAGEVAVPGTVQARQRASLSARFPASVIELPYQEGQAVPGGAVVVRLDDSAQKAALAAAEAGLVAAEADFARTKTLLDKNAATPRELEEQTARVAGVRAQVAGARDNLRYAVLRAPFGGRVAVRRTNVGDVVNPGMPLIEIEGQGGLEVRATVESNMAATLRPGSRVRALVDGQDEPLDATVSTLAPSGDATTHRFELKANLPSAPGLRAGLFARLLFVGLATESRLTVPTTAVFERGGLTGLFVVREGKAALRWVAVGARRDDTVEIRAGVESGERVVTAPAGLVDGSPVREANAASTAPVAEEARGAQAHPSEK